MSHACALGKKRTIYINVLAGYFLSHNNILLLETMHTYGYIPAMSTLQDRADRAARYAKTQEEEKSTKQSLLQAQQAEQDARKEAFVRERR